MIIRSVRHRGLRRLIVADDARFLRQDQAGRVRNVLTALILADDLTSFLAEAPPGWRVHKLSGDRHGEWSISVSRNWRITFEVRDNSIHLLNLEDYH